MAANGVKNGEADRLIGRLKEHSKAECFSQSSSDVRNGIARLEAGFYASEGYRSVRALELSGFQLQTIGALADDIIWFGPFARTYIEDGSRGVPMLTSSTMLMARPSPERVLPRTTPSLARLLVRDGYILISCSGTIGNVALCTKDVDGWACSQDAVRVVATGDHLGPIYCYLQSPVGQFMLKKSASGSVVTHLYEADVANLTVPVFPRALREHLTSLVQRASALRVEANALLDQAEEMVQKQLYLPDIEEFLRHRPGREHGSAHCFVSTRSRVSDRRFGWGSMRFDASACDPACERLVAHLQGRPGARRLIDVASQIHRVAPGKRTYTDEPERGLPLIGGKQLIQLRPRDLKFLSKLQTVKNATDAVTSGTTLISTGGTIGRATLVHRNFEGCVASEDVMRVTPRRDTIAPGFLTAFVSSPYGQLQLEARIFGSVIKRIRYFQLHSLVLRVPSDLGASVHDVVVAGYDRRADAAEAEDRAFYMFMQAVRAGRNTTEAEWGRDY